jgi:hypothetical protein
VARAKNNPKPPRDPAIDGLTYKQRLFVDFYLGVSHGNATDAARGGRVTRSPDDRRSKVTLRNITIRAAVEANLSAVLSAKEVLARLSEIATGNIDDFISLTEAGEPVSNLTRARKAGKMHLIRKIKPGPSGTAIEIHDPIRALEKLGQYHGLFDGDKPTNQPSPDKPRLTIPDADDRTDPDPDPEPDSQDAG